MTLLAVLAFAALRIGPGAGPWTVLACLVAVFFALFGGRRHRARLEAGRRARDEVVKRRQAALLRLLKETPGHIGETLRQVTEASAAVLGVERVSVWFYEDAPERIVCQDLFQLTPGRHSGAGSLSGVDFPEYFRALRTSRVLAADDARTDPRTREFRAIYLEPQGITSMMDVPVWLGGQVVGIVCHEHVGRKRRWTADEEEFASSVADVVAVGLALRERRRAEEALKESEERYRTLAESSGVGIWQITPEGRTIYANPALGRILGLRGREDLDRRRFNEFFTAAALDRMLSDHLRTGREACPIHETEVERVDGGRGRVVIYGAALRGESGDLRSLIGTFVDVTDRWAAEEALRQSEIRFRTLAEAVPEIVFSATADGAMEYANPRWREFAGDHVDSGRGWVTMAHPEDRLTCEGCWRKALAEGSGFEVQCRLRRESDGVYRWHLIRALPVRDAEGRVDRWFGTMTDIHEQKRTEAELLELRGTLEQRVVERTTRLEAALRELDAFTYTVAHDLRAPLRSMVGYSQVLLEEEAPHLGGPSKVHLSRIAAAAQRMDQLIRDLLEYSRLGRADQGVEAIDVRGVTGEVLRQMAGELEKRGADVRTEEPMVPVLGHRLSLALALGNLLSNAVKFVPPERAPQVRIRCRRQGDWARVEVDDNGLGVPAEYSERIFGVFERLGRDEKYPGTGIGLAIARRSVERMGGRTGVEPVPGGGSRFWIELRPAA